VVRVFGTRGAGEECLRGGKVRIGGGRDHVRRAGRIYRSLARESIVLPACSGHLGVQYAVHRGIHNSIRDSLYLFELQ
jgi:hypothetical protein